MLIRFWRVGFSFVLLSTIAHAESDTVLVRRGKEIIIASNKPLTDNIHTNSLRNSYATLALNSGASANGFSNEEIKVKKSKIEKFCKKVRRADPSLICEANIVFKTMQEPNDESYSLLPGLPKIDAPAAWNLSTGSKDVKIAVVDTGIDYEHEDLIGNLALNTSEIQENGIDDDNNGYKDDYYGYNFVDDDGFPYDDNEHGSHCSGTIGATGNNSTGISGINWNASLIGVKVLDSGGSGTLDAVAYGIDYAVARGAKVINLSLGSSSGPRILRTSIINAKLSNALVVVAAGNESENNDSKFSFPANYDVSNIIAVAAVDTNDELASFSNYGASTVHLAAPGTNILSTTPGSDYSYLSGTSMATPHVAGVAALLKSYKSELVVSDLKDIILSTVDSVSALQGLVKTGGRLNAYQALLKADNTTPSAPPTAQSGKVNISVNKSKSAGSGKITVSGKLSDSQGAFIGEKVTAFCNNKRKAAKTTDRNGNYTMIIKKGSSSMKCQIKDEFGSSSKRFSI